MVRYEEKIADFFFSSPDRYFEISECILETPVLDYSEFVLKRAKR